MLGCIIFFFMIDSKKVKTSNELSFIVLDKTYIGKGYRSQLIKHSLDKIRTNLDGDIFVKTLSSTTENIYFYKKNGFKVMYSKYNRTLLKYE